MKTRYIAIMLLAMLAGMSVKAQYSDQYYHRIGDIVQWRNPICYYQWWDAESFFYNRVMFHINISSIDQVFRGIRLCRYYTPDTLKVVGLCVMGGNFSIPTDSTEYLYLYDANGDSFVMKARIPWRQFQLDSCRYLWLRQHDVVYSGNSWGFTIEDLSQCIITDSCCTSCTYQWIPPMFEYYFDTGVFVADSFYVGASSFSAATGNYPQYWSVSRAFSSWSDNPYGTSCEDPRITNGESPDCWPPRFLYRMWLSDLSRVGMEGTGRIPVDSSYHTGGHDRSGVELLPAGGECAGIAGGGQLPDTDVGRLRELLVGDGTIRSDPAGRRDAVARD